MKKLLLATDFSGLARGAYSAAAMLAREHHAEIHLVHEAEGVPPLYYESCSPDFAIPRYYQRLREKIEEEMRHPDLAGLRVVPHVLCEESEHGRLADFARAEEMELIVIATRGRTGLSHAVLGSFTEQVARHATVPVLTYRKTERATAFSPRTILVPLDFSANSRAICPVVRSFRRDYGSDVRLLHVLPDETLFDSWKFGEYRSDFGKMQARSDRQLEKVADEELGGVQVSVETRSGRPQLEIVNEASRIGADLIIMATHGWTGLRHLFLGSVAEKVLRTAPCSVITVRPEDIRPQEVREGHAVTSA